MCALEITDNPGWQFRVEVCHLQANPGMASSSTFWKCLGCWGVSLLGRKSPISVEPGNDWFQYVFDLQVKILNGRYGADSGHRAKSLRYLPLNVWKPASPCRSLPSPECQGRRRSCRSLPATA